MTTYGIDLKVLENLPPDLLRKIPAGQPPSGVEPNFSHPPTLVPVVLGVSSTFLAIAFLCFALRIYTKLLIVKKWKWDDLSCSLGFSYSIVHYVVVVLGCIHGATGSHERDIHLDKLLNKDTVIQNYVTSITANPALGLIKLSLFIQFYSLFYPLRYVRLCVYIGAPLLVAYYASVTITAFALGSPWPGESLLDDFLSWHYKKFSQFSIPTGVIGIIVDWYLLILPMPAVWSLQLSSAKKIGVMLVFMTGGLAAISSIVSLVYRVKLQEDLGDSMQIEMFAGVTASSMPTVTQFFSRQNFSIASWASSLRSNITRLLSLSEQASGKRPAEDELIVRVWGRSNWQAYGDDKPLRMKNLISGGYKPPMPTRTTQASDSQVELTRTASATQI
ncbi:MAG: hypothetical protein M1821_003549 [Bathelium mastoideum]|nr:MAG: hypothetical protein M1821_003549 [Bathelium mastoideum]